MKFLFFFSILFSVSFGVHFFSIQRLSRIFEFQYSWKIFLLVFLLTANFIAVTMLSRKIWNLGMQIWYWLSVVYVGSIWILFSFLLAYGLVQLLAHFIFPIPVNVSQYVVVVGAVSLIVYSLFNACDLKVKQIKLVSDKLSEPLRLAQISDIHLGAIHGKAFVTRLVEKINTLNADLVVVTGDLFDGSGKVTEETLQEFHKLQSPAFFIAGNHDRFLPKEEVTAMLRHTPFRTLENEMLLFQDKLQIVGLDYVSRNPQGEVKEVLDQLRPDKRFFTLLLSHVPFDFAHADGHPFDLLLAGHTHSGQIFPFYFLVKNFYPYIRGMYTSGERHMYVSSGTSTWGPPMRLGTDSEVTLFQLSLEEKQAVAR
ncbi:MAG: metallophosphoesterase [bacterium]|nr:metallophosphoesterase [bacterium]